MGITAIWIPGNHIDQLARLGGGDIDRRKHSRTHDKTIQHQRERMNRQITLSAAPQSLFGAFWLCGVLGRYAGCVGRRRAIGLTCALCRLLIVSWSLRLSSASGVFRVFIRRYLSTCIAGSGTVVAGGPLLVKGLSGYDTGAQHQH